MGDRDPAVDRLGVDLKRIGDYYGQRLGQYGATAKGVDWGSDDKQVLRFRQLAACLIDDGRFSVLDVGCGYGAFWDHLRGMNKEFDYLGVDVSDRMIEEARRLHPGARNCRFAEALSPGDTADYVVASGIFNVMCGASPEQWEGYVKDTMLLMFARCRKAMACNFLTTYSDAEHRGSDLHYAEPAQILDFCIRNLSKDVRLNHHYGIWDFTVHVLRRA